MTRPPCDASVVGSGATGGTAALELARTAVTTRACDLAVAALRTAGT